MPAKKVVSTGRPPALVATERKRSLRLHGTIAQNIGVRIVSGRLRPGRVLNGEIEASAQLRALRDSLDRMKQHSLTSEAGQQADRQFHTALIEAAANRFLASLSSSVAAALLWMPVLQQGKGPLLRDPIPDHERVYEAIAAKDPEAAATAMTDLIQLALLDTSRRHGKPTRGRR